MLISEYFEDHYLPRKLFGKSPETVRLYRYSVSSFERTMKRPAHLEDLTETNLIRHMQRVIDAGRSRPTANKDRAQLLAIWRFACKTKMHAHWPEFVPELSEPKRVPEAWMPGELHALLRVARRSKGDFCGIPRSVWWESLILVCLDTGERIGAVREAEWSWISGDWITVPAESRKGGRRDKAFRLSSATVRKLREHQKWSPGSRIIFAWPYSYTYFWNLYRALLDDAGLPVGRRHMLHKIRRTTASVVDAAGMDATKALDHSSRAVTRAYLDPRMRSEQQPCDALTEFLAKPKQRNSDPPSQATG